MLPSNLHRSVDYIIEVLYRGWRKRLFRRTDGQAAAPTPNDQTFLDEIPVGVADGVVVNLETRCQGSDAGQHIRRRQFSRSDQKLDLCRDLLAKRNFAILADADLHRGACEKL